MNHADVESRVRKMTNSELEGALQDLNEVLAIQDRAPWADPVKGGEYHDERFYVQSEILRREGGAWDVVSVAGQRILMKFLS